MPKLKINRKAPQFTARALVNGKRTVISLSDYNGKYVILLFYPLDFTFTSPTEIIAFSDSIGKFHNVKTEILAISCDSILAHEKWNKIPRTEGGLGYVKLPLVEDKSQKISKSYGVLNEDIGVPYRGIFIIDERQLIRHYSVNDLSIGRSVSETLRLVEAIRKADRTGEECPVNWQPGDSTLPPDPVLSKDYFRALYNKLI